MIFSPTLQCPCRDAYLENAFAYDAPPAGETAFDLRGEPYRRAYRCCKLCSHWFGRHSLDLTQLYAHDYVTATYGGPDGMKRRFDKIMALPTERSDNSARVMRVRAFAHEYGLSGERSLLDVGAGLGVFPAAMRKAGWRVTALEPDLRTVEHLRLVAGVEALTADLHTVAAAVPERFDVISLNKVLEHVEDPVDLLAGAIPLLAKSGFVYVEVPDVAAAADGPGREEFFIEHHHVFSAASIALMAARAGLRVLRIETLREPSGKYTIRSFLAPHGEGMHQDVPQ